MRFTETNADPQPQRREGKTGMGKYHELIREGMAKVNRGRAGSIGLNNILVIGAILVLLPIQGLAGQLGTVTNQMTLERSVVDDGNALRSQDGQHFSPHCTNCIVGNITVASEPWAIAFDSANGNIYVTNWGSNNVSVISGTTNTVVGSVPVGTYPNGIAFDSTNGYLYVTNYQSMNVTVFNGATDTLVKSIPVGASLGGIAFDSANGYIYMADPNSGSVIVINGATNVVVPGPITAGSYPDGIAFDSTNGYLYVTNEDSYNVTVINGATDKVVSSVPVGTCPNGIAFDGTNGYLYVTNACSLNVTVINGATDTTVASVPLGPDTAPMAVAFDSTNGYICVANNGSANITVIYGATNKAVGSISDVYGPTGEAYDALNGYLYVTSWRVVVVSLSTFASSLSSVTIVPAQVTLSPSNIQSFTAIPTCTAGPCPTVTYYGWTLTRPFGTLTASNSPSVVNFTAGSTAGTVGLLINASVNGVFRQSSVAMITILLVNITSFIASHNPITVGSPTSLIVTASSGTPPYTYTYNSLPPGCVSSNTSTLPCTPTAPGTFVVTAKVMDMKGTSTTKTLTLTVNPSLTVTAFHASPNPIDAGLSTTFSVSLTGGTGPFTYVYTGLPTGCTSSNTSSLSCVPSSAGASVVTVNVTDMSHRSATSSTTLNVNPALSVSSFSASPNPITTGSTTTFTATVSGGTAPYSYTYYGLPTGCASSSVSPLQCTPTQSGTFTVTIYVTDKGGGSGSLATSLAVNPGSLNGPVISSFSADPNPVDQYSATIISVVASGGTAPYTFSYAGLPKGCASINTSYLTCNPTSTGVTSTTVTVTDSNGKYASATISIDVNPPLALPTFTASPSSVSLGSSTTFTVVETGGSAPYTYAYYALPPGCTPSDTATLHCTPTSLGEFNVSVVVSDTSGNSEWANTSLTVTSASSDGLAISVFETTPNPVTVGNITNISVTATGGTTPYSYSYHGLPPGCASANISVLACSPTQSGRFSIYVTVTDASKDNVSSSTVLNVNPVSLSIVSFAADPGNMFVNTSTNLSVSVRGGFPAYTYIYSGLPPGCATANLSSLSCKPTRMGNYTITVTVTDTNHGSASKALILVVTTPLKVTSFSTNANPVYVNTSVTLNVTASGGSPSYTYSYTGLPPGCLSSDLPSISCTPNAPGNFTMRVYVNDSASHSASMIANITVIAEPTLVSVSIAPSSTSITVFTSTNFTVTASCSPGSCPAGVTFNWSMNNSLGSVTPGVGAHTTFTAGSKAGAVTLIVTATLNGVMRAADAKVAITEPALSSVGVSPSSSTIAVGGTGTFAAKPVCSGGACPAGTTYSWTFNNPLGTLNYTLVNPVKFTAGNSAGTVTLFVNATLNGITVQGSAAITITSWSTLASVDVSPQSGVVQAGKTLSFDATITCTSSCPSGATYAWTLNNTLGSVGPATGPTTSFNAGLTAGLVMLTVNASLDGLNKAATATIAITLNAVPALTGVNLNTQSVTVQVGSTQEFTASPVCTPESCIASEIAYSWSMNNTLGTLNSTTGPVVMFTAGERIGSVTLTVTAMFNGQAVTSKATVTVSQGSTGTPLFSGTTVLIGALALAIVVVVLAVVLLLRRRRPRGATNSEQEAPTRAAVSAQAYPAPTVVPPPPAATAPPPTMSAPTPSATQSQPSPPAPTPSRFCPECGAKNARSSKFCEGCGKGMPPPS
jgi:YVTN family beta-propeller protein